jgi:hypothetical protein
MHRQYEQGDAAPVTRYIPLRKLFRHALTRMQFFLVYIHKPACLPACLPANKNNHQAKYI